MLNLINYYIFIKIDFVYHLCIIYIFKLILRTFKKYSFQLSKKKKNFQKYF